MSTLLSIAISPESLAFWGIWIVGSLFGFLLVLFLSRDDENE